MFKLLNKKKNNKGFTLVELVIVVAILAILVGILAPQYTKYVERSRKSADAANLENLVTAFTTAASDGTESIAADTYTISVGAAGSDVKKGIGDAATSDADVAKLMNTYVGNNWKKTNLKSKKWTVNANGSGDDVSAISAELKVAKDGSVTVTYNPTWLKTDLANAAVTPAD